MILFNRHEEQEQKTLVIHQENISQMKVILGDEFDDVLQVRLLTALEQLGAIATGATEQFMAGSQELEILHFTIRGRKIFIEAETYLGLSISGPTDLVAQVRGLLVTLS